MSLLGPSQDFKTIITSSESARGLIRLCLFHKSRNEMSRFLNSPDVQCLGLTMLREKHTGNVCPDTLKTTKKLRKGQMIYTRMFL